MRGDGPARRAWPRSRTGCTIWTTSPGPGSASAAACRSSARCGGLLIRLDADLLATILAGWLRTRTPPAAPRRPRYRQVIAVDGKTLRGARRADGSQVHLLSALDTSTGIVLAQVTVSAKSNEIPAFASLLDAIEQVLGSLKDLLFVADAMHTQVNHANEITARGAHLLIPVKGNRPTLHPTRQPPPPDLITAVTSSNPRTQ